MKKFVFTALSAALMLIGSNAFAQLSVNAGFTNSALKEKATVAKEDIKETTKANGFYFGGDYNIKLGKGFGIAPGVEWIYVMDNKVKSFDALVTTVKGETKFKEHYINVPVDVNWGIDLKFSGFTCLQVLLSRSMYLQRPRLPVRRLAKKSQKSMTPRTCSANTRTSTLCSEAV